MRPTFAQQERLRDNYVAPAVQECYAKPARAQPNKVQPLTNVAHFSISDTRNNARSNAAETASGPFLTNPYEARSRPQRDPYANLECTPVGNAAHNPYRNLEEQPVGTSARFQPKSPMVQPANRKASTTWTVEESKFRRKDDQVPVTATTTAAAKVSANPPRNYEKPWEKDKRRAPPETKALHQQEARRVPSDLPPLADRNVNYESEPDARRPLW